MKDVQEDRTFSDTKDIFWEAVSKLHWHWSDGRLFCTWHGDGKWPPAQFRCTFGWIFGSEHSSSCIIIVMIIKMNGLWSHCSLCYLLAFIPYVVFCYISLSWSLLIVLLWWRPTLMELLNGLSPWCEVHLCSPPRMCRLPRLPAMFSSHISEHGDFCGFGLLSGSHLSQQRILSPRDPGVFPMYDFLLTSGRVFLGESAAES